VKVVIFGATGMVGQGVLRECLLDPDVESVLVVVRNPSLPQHDKLREIVHQNVSDLSAIEDRLSGYEACFFCLGVSSVGMDEETYRRVTYDLTVSVAHTLVKLNPTMTFVYVSGSGTDSTERGRSMWVRVKGATENALLQMPFKAVFLFRPLYPLWKMLFPKYVTTTECLGRAMLSVPKRGFPKPVLENINKMCG
jgi:uncharacterized protein YbjT (DUF2867 family)